MQIPDHLRAPFNPVVQELRQRLSDLRCSNRRRPRTCASTLLSQFVSEDQLADLSHPTIRRLLAIARQVDDFRSAFPIEESIAAKVRSEEPSWNSSARRSARRIFTADPPQRMACSCRSCRFMDRLHLPGSCTLQVSALAFVPTRGSIPGETIEDDRMQVVGTSATGLCHLEPLRHQTEDRSGLCPALAVAGAQRCSATGATRRQVIRVRSGMSV